ncbi:MAG: UDP-N-acetylmuramyl-tripeptide synthetase [Patescibacteria group bacterium]
MIKFWLRKFIPERIISFYHFCLAKLAALVYGYPSRRLTVVGITGTGGKSSTAYILAKILEVAGLKVGVTSTFFFKVGDWEKLNDKKMTMLGRFETQRFLRRMVNAGCQVAIIETSSQGIMQHRHLDIDYDVAVLTNLYPEHLEAHGGFENYKNAKGKLFEILSKTKIKKFVKFPKTIIVNGDDEHAPYFLSFPAGRKIVFGLKSVSVPGAETVVATEPSIQAVGISFKTGEATIISSLLTKFNLYNVLCAGVIAHVLGLDWQKIKNAVAVIKSVPGRFEFIENGQPFKIMIDYAFEPHAMTGLYELAKIIPHGRIIHVLGSAGGGRDQARRPILGNLAGKNADYVVITNEDPYDDDPEQIIKEVAAGARAAGKIEGQNLFLISDRRGGIQKALSLAQPNDLVLITGKGSEQAICIKNGQKISWDDRQVVKEILSKVDF